MSRVTERRDFSASRDQSAVGTASLVSSVPSGSRGPLACPGSCCDPRTQRAQAALELPLRRLETKPSFPYPQVSLAIAWRVFQGILGPVQGLV